MAHVHAHVSAVHTPSLSDIASLIPALAGLSLERLAAEDPAPVAVSMSEDEAENWSAWTHCATCDRHVDACTCPDVCDLCGAPSPMNCDCRCDGDSIFAYGEVL